MYDLMVGYALLAGIAVREHVPPDTNISKRGRKGKGLNNTKKAKNGGGPGPKPAKCVDWESYGFCEDCEEHMAKIWVKQRQKLWERLNLWLELSVN